MCTARSCWNIAIKESACPMEVCYMPESLCKLDVLTHEHHLCTSGRGVMLLSIM